MDPTGPGDGPDDGFFVPWVPSPPPGPRGDDPPGDDVAEDLPGVRTIDGVPLHPDKPEEDRPVRRIAVVLAILLPFLVSVLGLVWAVRQGQNPRMAEAAGPGSATIERLGEGSYSLWARNLDGSAVRWNACETIAWVFNPDGAPLGAVGELQRAIDRVSSATGLEFEYLGETKELPTRHRSPYQPDRYEPDRWAPVLIAWRTPATTDAPLTDADRAVAIPVAVGTNEERAFVTAQVIFNREADGTPGFDDRRRSIGITMLHELAHVVGLQHVDDVGELMFPFPVVGDADFGPGDRAGLAEVGADHPCLETPEPEDIQVDYR